ncbi:MAG: SsrA-binding protein SmpB [Christensenellaceae bacterium]|jgi:SsrA-binding protein|nr:SsrA-binding protein SmpB [Christensenellaceae bacterium]
MNKNKIIATNKKAYHEYFIIDTYEAGIELVGSEVKSARLGNVNLRDCYAIIKNHEMLLLNAHFSPYKMGSSFNPEPTRTRRLLMHSSEILKIHSKVSQKGFTLVVTKLYFKDSLLKAEVALAKGKDTVDKRRVIHERDVKREADRTIKEAYSKNTR